MFKCGKCEQTFSRADSRARHEKSICGVEMVAHHQCTQCEESFAYWGNMINHIMRKHPEAPIPLKRQASEATNDGEPPLKRAKTARCNICDLELESREHLTTHRRSQEHLAKSVTPISRDISIVNTSFRNRIVSYKINSPKDDIVDISGFFAGLQPKVLNLVSRVLSSHNGIKFNLELFANYFKGNVLDDSPPELKSFNSRFEIVTKHQTDLDDLYAKLASIISTKASEFAQKQSGWSLLAISHLVVNCNRYSCLRGGSFIELPKDVANRKACINIASNGDNCFELAILAHLYPVNNHHQNPNRASSYSSHLGELIFDGIKFPVELDDIPKFENLNNLSVNVYGLELNFESFTHDVVGPLYLSKHTDRTRINLLLLTDNDTYHYCLIKNLARLVSTQVSKHKERKFLCQGCLTFFTTEENYKRHAEHDCDHVRCIMPTKSLIKNFRGETYPGNILKFRNFSHQLKLPAYIFADFECILKPIDTCLNTPSTSHTTKLTQHIPFSFAYSVVCNFNSSYNKVEQYSGLDCAKVFIERLSTDTKFIYDTFLKNIEPMAPLTPAEQVAYDLADKCHICSGAIDASDVDNPKVRDHCHITAKFRGPAHSKCNLNFKLPTMVPIFLHNLSGYDSHLFVKELACDPERIDVIPLNTEKYISFSKDVHVDTVPSAKGRCKNVYMKMRFVDSFRFLSSSIDKLAGNLDANQFVNITANFPDTSQRLLITRKGVFPYDYITDFSVLSETSLPPIDKFYNSLTDTPVSTQDYEHAQEVWKTFHCKTLLDYSELYVTTDSLLLSDIMMNFFEICYNLYGLEIGHYFTLPGVTWDAFLKYTGVELELFTDLEQYHFMQKAIRGGICTSITKHVRANNLHMIDYDDSKEISYLHYIDINNLYGCSLSDYLPMGGFEWVEDLSNLNFNIPDDSPVGYILEVTMEYPAVYHTSHNDFPFMPQNMVPPNSKFNHRKLIQNLSPKHNYVIHYRNLKQCIQNGLKLIEIHRVLKFKQAAYMKSYIDLNTAMRTKAKNAFEKDLFKLLNNACFGKSLQSVLNHQDIKLVSHWEDQGKRRGARSLIARPNFKELTRFDENLVAIHMNKLKVVYNKPIYIGFTVLELSKWLMYDFVYRYLKPLYRQNVDIIYADTDSLILHIRDPDAYENMRKDSHLYDTSNFADDNPFGIVPQNKAKLGLFKDENAGKIFVEHVGLRCKMYANLTDDSRWVKKAKGVKKYVVEKHISGEEFRECLLTNTNVYRQQRLFKSLKHQIFTQSQNKLALSTGDDKRHLLPCGIKSLAYGHYKLADIYDHHDSTD